MTTSVSYNILNLPSEVKFDDGHIVRYTYDAAGTKLKVEYLLGYIRVMDDWNTDRQPGKDVGGIKGINGISAKGFGGIGDLVSPPGSGMKEPITQMTLQYSAGHVYRNGRLERVDNPYGYWADGSFHYHITDYQGNIRAVIDEDGTLEEVNNYYPYGGLMGAGAMGVKPLKYGAKELDRENGLDLYDSHARFYDSMIGRTTSQDPLAEKYSGVSPYLWCAGNPIRNIDLLGDTITYVEGRTYKYKQMGADFGFYDESGNIYAGRTQFVSDLTEALNTIQSKPYGALLVSGINKRSSNVQIVNKNYCKTTKDGRGIFWDPNSSDGGIDINGSNIRPSFIGLAHELAHIWDKIIGLTSGIWLYSEDINGNTITIENSEKYAIGIENLIRSEHNIPLRKYYAKGFLGNQPDESTVVLDTYGKNIFYNPTILIQTLTSY